MKNIKLEDMYYVSGEKSCIVQTKPIYNRFVITNEYALKIERSCPDPPL